MEIIILTWSKWNENPLILLFSSWSRLVQGGSLGGVCPSFPANICVTSPLQRPGELLDGFQGSGIMWFLFFCFLVLPVYCYPPISLHPCAHMLSCNPMDCSPPEVQKSWTSPGKNTGVGCHLLLQIMCFSSVGLGGIFQDLVVLPFRGMPSGTKGCVH